MGTFHAPIRDVSPDPGLHLPLRISSQTTLTLHLSALSRPTVTRSSNLRLDRRGAEHRRLAWRKAARTDKGARGWTETTAESTTIGWMKRFADKLPATRGHATAVSHAFRLSASAAPAWGLLAR